jgi:hypothetical protein
VQEPTKDRLMMPGSVWSGSERIGQAEGRNRRSAFERFDGCSDCRCATGSTRVTIIEHPHQGSGGCECARKGTERYVRGTWSETTC